MRLCGHTQTECTLPLRYNLGPFPLPPRRHIDVIMDVFIAQVKTPCSYDRREGARTTDSTMIAPPKTCDFLEREHFMVARHEEGCYEKASSNIFMYAKKGLSNDDVGVARGTVFQETRPGAAGFKTGDSLKEKLGGLPYNDSHLFFWVSSLTYLRISTVYY